jgi:V8-like Glu-specific endopeptidase
MKILQIMLSVFATQFAHAGVNTSDKTLNASVVMRVKKYGAYYICSGSLIQNNVVVTAGHCVDGAEAIQVTNGTNLDAQNKFVDASGWKTHPSYNGTLDGVDMGVIKLSAPIEAPEYYQPRALSDNDLKKTNPERVGYGGRDDTNERNLVQEHSAVKINALYFQAYDENGVEGDSGGPVFTRDQNSLALIGVHSGRKYEDGALANFSNTLAMTSDLINWIHSTTAQL